MELENIVANTVLLKAREGKLGWSGACTARLPRAGVRVSGDKRACRMLTVSWCEWYSLEICLQILRDF
jgi:hypothetical protein